MDLNRIFAVSPYVEVVGRRIYWRSDFLIKRVAAMRARQKGEAKKAAPPPRTSIARVVENLGRRGVGPGDILVVQRALRHRNIESTLRYAALDDRRVREAIEA